VMVSIIGMNMACLKIQSIITRIVSKLDEWESFLIKFINIKFYEYYRTGSCLRSL